MIWCQAVEHCIKMLDLLAEDHRAGRELDFDGCRAAMKIMLVKPTDEDLEWAKDHLPGCGNVRDGR